MIKRIDIAGIEINNYTVRESIMEVERSLSNGVFNTMEEISMEMLLGAEADPILKEALEMLDHSVISETGILEAIGDNSIQRHHEVQQDKFYTEIMKRVERNHKTVYMIGKTAEDVERMKELVQKEYSRIRIVGTSALEDCIGNVDAIINELNSMTPDMVLSVLPSPEQEHFLVENKDKLSTNLWYGVGNNKLMSKKRGLAHSIQGLLHKKRLVNSIKNYEEKDVVIDD